MFFPFVTFLSRSAAPGGAKAQPLRGQGVLGQYPPPPIRPCSPPLQHKSSGGRIGEGGGEAQPWVTRL